LVAECASQLSAALSRVPLKNQHGTSSPLYPAKKRGGLSQILLFSRANASERYFRAQGTLFMRFINLSVFMNAAHLLMKLFFIY